MLHPRFRRTLAPAVLAALLLAAPAPAAAQLPIDPGGLLPDPGGLLPDPGDLPGGDLPGGDLPDLPGGDVPDLPGGDVPDLPGLPGGLLPGSDPSAPGTPGGDPSAPGTPGGTLDAAGPTIAGPSKAPTVRVDSKRRFRIGGVVVTCPAGCRLSVKVSGPGGVSYVKRTFDVPANGSLQLKKLKVSAKALKALRKAGVARVTARLKASPLTGASVARDVGMKLKPEKR